MNRSKTPQTAPALPGKMWSRRAFLERTVSFAAASPLAPLAAAPSLPAPERSGDPPRAPTAIAFCKRYAYPEVRERLKHCLDLLGDVSRLVRGRHVTVKTNLVNTSREDLAGIPLWLTVTVHPTVAMALASLLAEYGAREVLFCDQLPFRPLGSEAFAGYGFKLEEFRRVAKGRVRFLNTRNRGPYRDYALVKVPDGGDLATCWEVNRAYADTDVLVSLAKLKDHVSAGMTAGMKNLFGLPPSSLYGDDLKDGPDEAAVGYRNATMHNCTRKPFTSVASFTNRSVRYDHGINVPRFIVDLNAAFPIRLTVIDAISTIQTAEGWWNGAMTTATRPGLLIAGRNPVCADAVAAAVMGYDPEAPDRTLPFVNGLNYLALARRRGLGENRLRRLEILGVGLEEARFEFRPTYRRINPHKESRP